jgi:DNA-binding CsgD family transcriptional regulator
MTNLLDLMISTRDVSTIDELNSVMAKYFDNLGFDKYAYVLVNNPHDPRMNNSYVSNYPVEWENQYTSKDYFIVDPLYELFKAKSDAFDWSWTKQKDVLNPLQKKFFMEASDFNVDRGVGVPIFTPKGGFSIVSLCSNYIEESEMADYLVEKRKDLIIASLIHHQATLALKSDIVKLEKYNLTERELETLHWLCQNKTYIEIGMILGLQRTGVTARLQSIYRKMGACGRVDAVKKAIRSGLITPI